MNQPQSEPQPLPQSKIEICREKAFYARGTAVIFERRVCRYSRNRNYINYLGVVVPLLVGGINLSFDSNFFNEEILPYVKILAGVSGVLLLLLSVWSLIAKWDDHLSYALGAMKANYKLYDDWKLLADLAPIDIDIKIIELEKANQLQSSQDYAEGITEKEKQAARQDSLFHINKNCPLCGAKPSAMKSSHIVAGVQERNDG